MVCLVHALAHQDSLPATTYHQVQVSGEYGRSSAKNTYQNKYRLLKVRPCTLPALGKYQGEIITQCRQASDLHGWSLVWAACDD